MQAMAEVPKKPKRDQKLNITVTPDEKSAWLAEAQRQEVPVARLISHAMAEYLARVEKARKRQN